MKFAAKARFPALLKVDGHAKGRMVMLPKPDGPAEKPDGPAAKARTVLPKAGRSYRKPGCPAAEALLSPTPMLIVRL